MGKTIQKTNTIFYLSQKAVERYLELGDKIRAAEGKKTS